jgi:hypothetical protein
MDTRRPEMAALIGVFHDETTARSVVQELYRQTDPTVDATVNEPGAAAASTVAEMQVEVGRGWGGIAAFLTPEQARGAVLFSFVFGVIGGVVGLPVGLLFTATSSLALKLGIGALIGALFGSTVGALLGGGLAMQSVSRPTAAERGVTVVCSPDSKSAVHVMEAFDPIRIDRVEDGEVVETPTAEGPSGVRESLDELVRNSRDATRQG